MENTKPEISAVDFFHKKPEHFNCSQAILKRFQEEFNIADAEIEAYRAWGGGRAEGGVCGALFAAEGLAQKYLNTSLKEDFQAVAGHSTCKEIKNGKFSCVACVKLAEALLNKKMQEK
jgi:hypothetical protein